MIKELIEKESHHREIAENLSEDIFNKLRPIFDQLKKEYIRHAKSDLNEYIDKKHEIKFYKYSSLDGYRIKNDLLILNYYDYGYDCYDCDEFEIPLEIIEKDLIEPGKALEWYKGIFEAAAKKKEEKKIKDAEKTKERELAVLKRLQEKYKNKL